MRTLILKSLNACNLRCAYCSLGDKDHASALSEENMLDALRFFSRQALEAGEERVQVIFHGGEPMLIPPEQYGHCIQTLQAEFSSLKFRFSLQTNGTLLTPAYLELFQTYDIRVGVSIDGGSEVHDRHRCGRSGEGTYSLVMKNIQTMLAYEIPVAALMVVTKPAIQADLGFLLDFDALGLSLKMNPLLPLGDAECHPELALDPGEYGGYLIRVFEYAAEKGLTMRLSPLAELLQAILYEQTPRGCQFDPSCSRRFLCIDQEGNLYPCGRFADVRTNILGSVADGIRPEGRMVLEHLASRRTSMLPSDCRTCRYLRYCNAGCSADGAKQDREFSACLTCEDQKVILHYLMNDGLKLVEKQLLEERGRLEKLLTGGDEGDGI